jgi:hypothetical protein
VNIIMEINFAHKITRPKTDLATTEMSGIETRKNRDSPNGMMEQQTKRCTRKKFAFSHLLPVVLFINATQPIASKGRG